MFPVALKFSTLDMSALYMMAYFLSEYLCLSYALHACSYVQSNLLFSLILSFYNFFEGEM